MNSPPEFSDQKRCREETDPARVIPKEPIVVLEKGAEPNGANLEHSQVCPKFEPAPSVNLAIPIVIEKKNGVESNEAAMENPIAPKANTPNKKKWEKKTKGLINCQGEETKKPGVPRTVGVEERGVCFEPEPATPVDIAIPIELDKKKGIELNEATSKDPELFPVPDQTPQKEWESEKKNVLNGHGEELKEPNAENRQLCLSVDSEVNNTREVAAEPNEAIAEKPHGCSKHGPTPLLNPAMLPGPNDAIAEHPELLIDPPPLKDPPQKKKRQRKKRSRKGAVNHTLNQTQPQSVHLIDPVPPVFPKPVPSIGQKIQHEPTIQLDPEQKTMKKRRKKRRKSALTSDGTEHNTQQPENPVQRSLCPITAVSTDLTIPVKHTVPIDPAIPVDPGQKITNRKRKRKRKNALKSKGVEPNKHNAEQSDCPIQRSTCPLAAAPLKCIIPINQKQRNSALKSDGTEHNTERPETPVERSLCPITAVPTYRSISVNQTVPVDPVISIVPEQKMTNRKRKRKSKSALKSKGVEPNKHNAEQSDTPIQRSTCPISAAAVKLIMPLHPSTPVDSKQRKTKKMKKKKRKSDLKCEGQNLMGCQACQLPGHSYLHCPTRQKHLTRNQEICFFCGEIGHSLGTCSVSQAGGGKFFARCLFCYRLGHLSNNCPGNGRDIDPKVVAGAANGPINTMGAEGKSIAEVTNM